MITDAFTRLSNAQDLDGVTASALSTNGLDTADRLGRSSGSMFATKERAAAYSDGGLTAVFTIVNESVSFASGDDETVRFQLITTPTVDNGTIATSGVGSTNDFATTDGKFLPNGTLVTATAVSNVTAASTHYYVVRDSVDSNATRFRLSTTPNAGDAITFSGDGTPTLTVVPQIIADSGEIAVGRLRMASDASPVGRRPGDQVMITTNPLPSSPTAPLHRYVYARYIVTSEVAAGKVTCDVGISVPDNRGIYHAVGSEIK